MPRAIVSIAVILSFVIFGGVMANQINMGTVYVSYYDLIQSARNEVDCLADNIYFEARGETEKGWLAIATVTLNRVKAKQFPKTICNVISQRRQARCQFSWWCNNKLRIKSQNKTIVVDDYELYKKIHRFAFNLYINSNNINDTTNGALFFHSKNVSKHRLGVPNLIKTAEIDNHIFYKIIKREQL